MFLCIFESFRWDLSEGKAVYISEYLVHRFVIMTLRLSLSERHKGVYKTTTATAMGTSLNKRINEQYNSCARAVSSSYTSLPFSFSKEQREMAKFLRCLENVNYDG